MTKENWKIVSYAIFIFIICLGVGSCNMLIKFGNADIIRAEKGEK